MDSPLLIVALISVVAALGFGGFTWHLLREQRRRSDARVTALAIEIDAQSSNLPGSSESPASLVAHPVEMAGALFATERSAAARGNPIVKAAVGVAMAILLIVAIAMANRSPGDETVRRAEHTPAAVRGVAPLELISMRHTRDGDRLTVSGLVRNPRGAGNVTRVTAVVFAFDRAGTFIASGRAPLDFTTLEPGDESPFVVTVPGVSDVGRYRVSFRTEAGVMRHVDRRAGPMQLAAVHLH